MTTRFMEKVTARWSAGARVCVGLDPVFEKMPVAFEKGHALSDVYRIKRIEDFLIDIIAATKFYALAYKPNIAFFSGEYGARGNSLLQYICEYIATEAPDVPIILDSKRTDIGNTNQHYVTETLAFKADAVTVNPYFGMGAMGPFFHGNGLHLFVLCRTSNVGADQFQNLRCEYRGRSPHLYQVVAQRVSEEWDAQSGNCGLVAGATYAQDFRNIREYAPKLPLLIPGIGTQGGDLEQAVKFGYVGPGSIILNAGSSILYASRHDYADAARAELIRLTEAVDAALPAMVTA